MINLFNSNQSSLAHYQSINGYNTNSDQQYAEFHPKYLRNLICTGQSYSGVDNSHPDGVNCFYSEDYLEWVDEQIEDGPDYIFWANIIAASLECFEESGGGIADDSDDGGILGEVLSSLEYVNMLKINDNGGDVIFEFNPQEDLFDDTGEYTPAGPSVIEPGLYNLTFKFPSNPPVSVIFENKNRMFSDLPLSSFMSANVFPVPIIESNSFNINFETTATTEFTYELFDSQGNILHKNYYRFRQGHNDNHKIITETSLPDGLLFHKFTFLDGSHSSITTIK